MDIKHEQPHRPSDDEHAQESWYFNWTDLEHDMFGLARTGFRYHDRQPEPLVLTITGNHPEFVFPAETVPQMTGNWDEIDAADGLMAGSMSVTMEEPFKRWRIKLNGANSMDLLFESFTPVFNYHAEGRKLAPSMTTNHFEQSCRVTGWIDFNGNKREINGFGQRDKSWGVRAWPDILGWDWISAQFEDKITFNVMQTREKQDTFLNGFIFRDGSNYAITEASISYEWGGREQEPAKTRLELVDETGVEHLITAQTQGIFPLPKTPVMLEECYSVFVYHGPTDNLTGGGVVEHVWRP
jgi:hypothetical protein